MPTTPSPLRYPGGKTAYTPMLQRIISDNELEDCDYVEPFAGGAGAAISLLLSNTVSRIWLNDLDFAIYAFWKAITAHTDEFIALLRKKRVSLAEWKRQRAVYNSPTTDVLEKGFSAFYLNRCNRSGILAANPIGGLRPAQSLYRINARFNKKALEEKIQAIASAKDRIFLSNLEAKKFLRRFKTTNPKVLIYFDPPYYQKGNLLYLNHFTHEDHCSLSKNIRACDYPWVLSYDEHCSIKELYKGIAMYRRNLNYSISTPSIGKELIFSKLSMPFELECV